MKNQNMGLSTKQAEESVKKNGSNKITVKKKKTFWQTYMGKYDDPIIIILLVALGINVTFTFFGKVDWHECAGILLSVLTATLVSALSEFSNENTFQKLQEEAANIKCKVYRDNALQEILSDEIAVGDTVLLQTGDMIPADGRVISGRAAVDQSSLNGESKEVEKKVSGRGRKRPSLIDFWDEENLYRGSLVCNGECLMTVESVGDSTVYGKMTVATQEEVRESPLTLKLKVLADGISRFGYISALLIVIISFCQNAFFSQGFDTARIAAYFADLGRVGSDIVNSVIVGIVVIVVAVPEGLPLMIAIVCSLNMKKMLKSKVLVRKLIGIETAGGINILFSDKTGTITKGKPRVAGFINGLAESWSVFAEIPDGLKELVEISVFANSLARFSQHKIIGGNSSEKAMLSFVGENNQNLSEVEVVASVPFSSVNKFSAARISGKYNMTLVKGAPELLLEKCDKYYNANGKAEFFANKSVLERKLKRMADDSVRLIALAVSNGALNGGGLPEGSMSLVGIMAVRDEVRREASLAIKELYDAGIQTVMITGDRKETAAAIAKEAGLLNADNQLVITSAELAKISDAKLKKILKDIRVVARALPTDKSRLVRVAQEMNMVVGMTGDGVNDAPALKLADVGFAMGSGSEVAKEAGDIVILDDNFFSIRNAVLYGRTIYKSIKKFIKFQLTINIAAVTISILGPIVGIEKPLNISQMIWTNLMIDSLAAIAFGGEPALRGYLKEKPHGRDERILDSGMWSSIIWNGMYICTLSLLIFISPKIHSVFRAAEGDLYFYTGYFTFFIFICIFNAFNVRTDSMDIFKNLALNKQFLFVMGGISVTQIVMTYCGGALLRTAGLDLSEWFAVICPALTIIPFDIARKFIMRRKI